MAQMINESTTANAGTSRTGEDGVVNPFLTGIHTPLTDEFTLARLDVIGAIPPALTGRYLRTGPNPIAPDPASYHWFAGDGMVHGVVIDNGQALGYSNRWIRSNNVARLKGMAPAPGPRHLNDTVNTNVVDIGGRTFTVVEAGSYPVELGTTLRDQVYTDFDGTLAGGFSAHPHRDHVTGQTHAICYEANDPGTIRHVVLDGQARVIREEPIAVEDGPLIHDCAFTERFLIILDLPVTLSGQAAGEGFEFPYRWNPDHPARVGLLPRAGRQDEIVWCKAPSGFAFHVANAYDDADGRVVLDLCVFETMFGDGATGPDAVARGLERWTIDPATRAVDVRTVDPAPQDFPCRDDRFFGRPYRYAWSVALPLQPVPAFLGETKLYAHDLVSGRQQVHEFGADRFPGEFVFVPETPDSPEGHGWLIGFVLDMGRGVTELVILDARRFEQIPLARIRIPHRVPPGFHGNWFAGKTDPA